MWTIVSPNDREKLERFRSQMGRMARRLETLDPGLLVSRLSRGRGQLHHFLGTEGELFISFSRTFRRGSYFICVGFDGSMSPEAALELMVERSLGFAAREHLDVLYAIKRPMDFGPLEQLHALVSSHPRLDVRVVDVAPDSVMWEIRRAVSPAAATHAALAPSM